MMMFSQRKQLDQADWILTFGLWPLVCVTPNPALAVPPADIRQGQDV